MAQIIDVPGMGEVEFPDDMSDADISAAIRRSLEASGATMPTQTEKPAQPPSGDPGALSSSVLAGGQAMTFGWGDEIGAGLEAIARVPIDAAIEVYNGQNIDKPLHERIRDGYNQGLRSRRELMEYARDQHPVASTAGAVAGGLAMATRLPSLVPRGAGLPTTALTGAVEGGLYGAVSGAGEADGDLADRARGLLNGGATGFVVGGAAPAALAGGGAALRYVDQAIRANIGSPSNQAATRILNAARSAGLDDAAVAQRLRELGQEGMVVDVLGTRGEALARSAANVSPEAQGALETASHARMAGQNDRVVASLEQASGLPVGSRQTVDDLKDAAYARVAPSITQAYNEARALGFDLPLDEFQAIISSPMGARAFNEASETVRNRMAANGINEGSNLALLDAMKKRLDAIGRVTGGTGDNDLASQAQALARRLREQTDDALADPVYANARGLRRDAYRTEEAYDTGAELARPRVALDAPTRARAAAVNNAEAVAQGYAATQAANLLNRRSTPGAIDALNTRMAQESMDAALGPAAGDVRNRLAAEQQFGRTHRALTGNSTTARQLAQMGMTAGAGAGLGLYAGLDPTSAGAAGIAAALARKGGGAALSALRSNNEAAVAPYMARFLTEQGLPVTRDGVRLVMRTPWMRQLLGRTLAGVEGGEASRAAR